MVFLFYIIHFLLLLILYFADFVLLFPCILFVFIVLFYFGPNILGLFLQFPLLPNIIIFCVFRFLNIFIANVRGEVPLSLVVGYISLQYMKFWRVMKTFRWSRRQWRILGAVCDDIRKSSKARDGVDERYGFLYSDQSLGKTRLEPWVQRTEDVVKHASFFFTKEPKSLALLAGAYQWLRKQLLFTQSEELDSISENLSWQRNEFDSVKDIYKELEKSRAKLRSLEDMLIEDESEYVIQKQLLDLITSMQENAAQHISKDLKRKHVFKFKLLAALLMDLQHAKLESAIEKAWFEEMKALFDDTENALNTFTKRKERKGLYKLFNFIFSVADNLLQIDLEWLDDDLTMLLEMRIRYGLILFIIQQQTDPCQKVLDNHVHILSVVENVCDTDGKIRSLFDELVKTHRSLKAIKGASNFRIECSDQLKTIADELNKMVNKQAQNETRPIGRQTYYRKKFIGACDWMRRKSSSIIGLEDDTYALVYDMMKFIGDWIRRKSRSIIGLEEDTDALVYDIKKFIGACDWMRRKSSSIIGLEEDTDALVSKLTQKKESTTGSEQCCVFFIVGMQGIGKTTLAKKIYHHKHILEHFSDRIWISVPNNDINAVLKDVRNQITRNNEPQEPEEVKGNEHYIQKIQDFLKNKKYLLVLDNVPTNDVWDKLKGAFSKSESSILLTTRDRTVDSQTKPHQCHHLRLRTKEESWDLFREKVQFPPELLRQEEMLKKPKEVVGSCWGLPLSLSRLSVLMAGETIDSEKMSRAFEQVDQFQTLLSETLQINDLPRCLRSLLSFFTLFPKNFEIPARRLIALWVAEGLVLDNDQEKTLENVAESKLLQLIGLNIIQPLKMTVDGKAKTCCLPNPLHDLVLSTSSNSHQQRLVDHNGCNDACFELEYGKNLISFISFDSRGGDKPGNDIGNFLHRGIANGWFKKLKVLDLERVFKPQLPKTIGKLIELRYLGLRWTYLEEIPSTIGNLLNLQTLDLKHTNIRTLPNTIWKLQKLRHLYLDQAYWRKFVHQPQTRSFRNLQTLRGVFLDENSFLMLDMLDKLKSLRKLELSFDLRLERQKVLASRIAGLTNLRSLRLRSVSVMSEPQVLHLGNFKQLESLSSMYLFGRLKNALDSSKFSDGLSDLTLSASEKNALDSSKFPEGLSDLTLSAFELEDDPMPVLEKFPNLRSLCLFAGSFNGKRMVCSKGGFSQLRVLKIWKLNNLTDWTIEEEAMQNLKELDMRSCPTLLKVPDGLMHLQTLREVKLANMNKEFSGRLEDYIGLRQDSPSIHILNQF